MRRLIHVLVTAASIVLFVNLGTAALAFDPFPFIHRHHREAQAQSRPAAAVPGATLAFIATAYCQSGITQSGVDTHTGIAAADPAQLPVGSVVQVDTDIQKYNGIYTVLDTGTKVQGQKLDLFMHDCHEAQHFGRQAVRVTVLRKGWSPKASAPKAVVAGVGGK